MIRGLAVALTVLACAGPLAACTSRGESTRVPAVSERSRGKAVFTADCAACHGATGLEGGFGPSLRDERNRMDLATTISWIKDPQPPMAKLYPKFMTNRDVRDVATYVQSL